MLPTNNPPNLPSFNIALDPDHHKSVLPNLSYPSRPSTYIPWTDSSASRPLVFSKTTPPEPTVASTTPNVQAPTSNICFDTCSVPDAFYGVSMSIWHYLSMIVQKLKLMKQKLFGV